MSASSKTERDTVAASVLRALWYVVIPLLLTCVALRYLRPRPADGRLWLVWQALGSGPYGLWIGLGLFLLSSLVVRYWCRVFRLPWVEAGAARQGILRTLGAVAAAALLALALRATLGESFRVEGVSMLPTLEPGDYVAVSKRAYRAASPAAYDAQLGLPQRGDVVVLRHEARAHVKRVLGLPGDQVVVREQVSINGWAVPKCDAGRYFRYADGRVVDGRLSVEFLESSVYLTLELTGDAPPKIFEHLVGPGEIFVLGDDRGMSVDSRAWEESSRVVTTADIVGRVDRVMLREPLPYALGFRHVFAPLDLDVTTPGVDVRPLQAGIARCLAEKPTQTRPPAPGTPLRTAAGQVSP